MGSINRHLNKSIAIGSDHAGFALKEAIRHYLDDKKIPYTDFGAYSEESVDYPEIAVKACESVTIATSIQGILCCGSGIGMSIVANKVQGIRAALCYTPELAKMSRLHNNANILVLAGRYTEPDEAFEIIKTFLETDFEGGRHKKRVDLIHSLTRC
ncbi:ribose 5-phosphate isomerase B [bacterium]|nr:ribose 5-phosphate isomerase B [bacterium]